MFEDCIAMLGNLHNGACAKCQSDDDLFAGEVKVNLVNGFNSSLPGGKTKAVYETQAKAKTHSCSYTCNTTGGYFFFPASNDGRGNRCAECVEGTKKRENGKRVCEEKIEKYCEDGYYYDEDSGECVKSGPQGHCWAYEEKWSQSRVKKGWYMDDEFSLFQLGMQNKWGYFTSENGLRAYGIEQIYDWGSEIEYEKRTIDDFRPMTGNILRSCTNDETSIKKHSCEYTCDWNEGMVCAHKNENNNRDSYQSCMKAECNFAEESRIIGAINRGMIQDNPNKQNVNKYGRESRKYIEAYSQEDFESKVPNEGCYYRCPDELLYDKGWHSSDGDVYRYLCYSSKKERDEAIEKDNNPIEGGGSSYKTYVCTEQQPLTLWGYSQSQTYSYSPNTKWMSYAQIGGFEANQSRGCLEGCTQNTTHVIENSEYNGETVCRKKCEIDEYFLYSQTGGGCKKCKFPWQFPSPYENDRKDNNPTKCVDVCESGYSFCSNCGLDGGIGCEKISYTPGQPCDGTVINRSDGAYCIKEPIVYAKEFPDGMFDDVGDYGGTNRD